MPLRHRFVEVGSGWIERHENRAARGNGGILVPRLANTIAVGGVAEPVIPSRERDPRPGLGPLAFGTLPYDTEDV